MVARRSTVRQARRVAAALALATAVSSTPAPAQEPSEPLRVRVRPGGYEGGGETLEQKLARRFRESEFMFQSICRGCMSPAAEGQVFGRQSNGIQIPVPENSQAESPGASPD